MGGLQQRGVKNTGSQLLVVRQREASVTPSLREAQALVPGNQTALQSVGKACGWKHLRAPTLRSLFQDGRTTPAVLAPFRETRVGDGDAAAPGG